MKRLIALFLVFVFIFCLTGWNRIRISYAGNAILNYRGQLVDDSTTLTRKLTEEETRKVGEYLSAAVYSPGIGGCPFDENISITFGDQVFAIAYDDCPTVWIYGTDRYYTMSDEGRAYIVSLFEKYVGYFPFPR